MSSIAAKPKAGLPEPSFVWSAEGKPVSVHLSLAVVRELEAALPNNPAEGTRPEEFGGLLLGRVREGAPDHWLVSVDRHEAVECEHVRGASWILSKHDHGRLRSKLESLSRRRDGLSVVGWYRTHTRPGLFLDQHDFELFQRYFSAPSMVALAIRPGEQPHAGFFIWEDGDVHRTSSYSTFPFAGARLSSAAFVKAPPQIEPALKVVPLRPAAAKPASSTAAGDAVAAPRRKFPWKAAALWAPVVVGGLAGILWNPDPLRAPKPTRTTAQQPSAPLQERAVYAAPEPMIVTPVPEPAPVPAAADQTRARKQEPAPRRQLTAAASSRPPSLPVLVGDAPAIPMTIAMRTEGLPALKVEPTPFLATATLETPKPSTLRRAVGSIPGLGFLKKKKKPEDFVPARAIHQVRPTSPASLTENVPVRVKLHLDDTGKIVSAEPVGRRVNPELSDLAVDAASRWRFEPARSGEAPVPTEVVVQFRFGPGS